MKKFDFSGKKERGVVLLTCLVFLLILLLMLRFTITSARVEEQKSAIDLDIVTARESAQSGLNYIEFYIRRQGELYCGHLGNDPSTCVNNPWAYANLLFAQDDANLKNMHFWDAPDIPEEMSIQRLIDRGIYTGTFLRTNAANCDPTWICVKWPATARAVVNSAAAQRGGGVVAGLDFITCPPAACNTNTAVVVQPRMIIERLNPRELDPDESGLGEKNSVASKGVILRVTVVGFGAGPAGAGNLSNVMLQNVYVLPNS